MSEVISEKNYNTSQSANRKNIAKCMTSNLCNDFWCMFCLKDKRASLDSNWKIYSLKSEPLFEDCCNFSCEIEKAAFKIQVLINFQYFLKTSLQIKFTSSEIENSSIQFKKRESASVVFLSRCKNNRKSIAKQFPSFIRSVKISPYRILLMGIDHFTSHSFAI